MTPPSIFLNNHFKGTLQRNMAMPDLLRYPLTLCLIKYEWNILFLFIWTVYLHLWFLLRIRTNREIHRNKYFRVRKTTFLIKFQLYRCKSGNVIFIWRVTWNYAYTPFNTNFYFTGAGSLSVGWWPLLDPFFLDLCFKSILLRSML